MGSSSSHSRRRTDHIHGRQLREVILHRLQLRLIVVQLIAIEGIEVLAEHQQPVHRRVLGQGVAGAAGEVVRVERLPGR